MSGQSQVGRPVQVTFVIVIVSLLLAILGFNLTRYFPGDGSSLSKWEDYGGYSTTPPSVTSWSENRQDVFATFLEFVLYRCWDGSQWNPVPSDGGPDWIPHTPEDRKLASTATSVSWAENNLNVFTFDVANQLRWQIWEGSQWLPAEKKFYELGELPISRRYAEHRSPAHKAINNNNNSDKDNKKNKKSKPSNMLVVQDPESMDL